MQHRAFIRTKDGWFSCVYDGEKEIVIGDKMDNYLKETHSCDYGFALYKDKDQILIIKNRYDSNVGNTYDIKVEGDKIWLL